MYYYMYARSAAKAPALADCLTSFAHAFLRKPKALILGVSDLNICTALRTYVGRPSALHLSAH